jgi:hypothetical protein
MKNGKIRSNESEKRRNFGNFQEIQIDTSAV